MARVVLIGGGFAGLAAAAAFRGQDDADVVLLDRRPTFDFLPMLPDVIGERADPDLLTYDLAALGRRLGFRFVHDTVTAVDLNERHVVTEAGGFDYDYLLIAAGTRTNFHGQAEVAAHAFALDSVAESRALHAALAKETWSTVVVVGGGYTGVEAATNARAFFRRLGADARVMICELAPRILGPMPDKFRRYTRRNLDRMDIEVRVETSVEAADADSVRLSSGEALERALLIWSAGVQTPAFVRDLPEKPGRQGRLPVDRFLRVDERGFAAGNAALFQHGGAPLRLSVQFSLGEGRCAARNILRSIRGQELRPFRPRDLGYVVPMANNRSCGVALGVPVYGFPATLLHYLMCIVRSRGVRRRLRMIQDLTRIF
jgi:NADH dehydrogenase